MKSVVDRLLDATVVFSFDRSGFLRHCPEPLQLPDLSGSYGILTGASSGIGLAASKRLVEQGMHSLLVGRDLKKLTEEYSSGTYPCRPLLEELDLSDLKAVYLWAQNVPFSTVDLLVHNAGAMPLTLTLNGEGHEVMFVSQVLAPFLMTQELIRSGRLRKGARVIFMASGGMYLQKLDIADIDFKNRPYNKYTGYANAKRAQVILTRLFSEKYPDYLFSAMHPGWVDTPGVRKSLPLFSRFMDRRFRTPEEGADTLLWLATAQNYPSGKFWFDRKEAEAHFWGLYKSTEQEDRALWDYCEKVCKEVVEQ